MSLGYPIERDNRARTFTKASGQTSFGPVSFKVWDAADVAFQTRANAAAPWLDYAGGSVTVTLTAAPPATFTVSWTGTIADGTACRVIGRRIDKRLTDVTRGGAISSQAVERDLDIASTIAQETRRDIADTYAQMVILGDAIDNSLNAPRIADDLLTGAISNTLYATTPGTGYALDETLTVVGGTGTAAVYKVWTTKLVSVTLTSGGSGYAVNDELQFPIAVSGQVYVNARLRVTAVSGGAITAWTIIDPGEYGPGSLPTSFTTAAISGSGSGATFNAPVWGVGQAYRASAGNYTAFPTSPVATTAGGSGSGATLPIRWGDNIPGLRDLLGRPELVESASSYLRSSGRGMTNYFGPNLDQQFEWWIVNDRSRISPYTGLPVGDDSKYAITCSDWSITSTQLRRTPENNATNVLQTCFFQFVRDVANPATGSYLFTLYWAGRTTGSSIVDMYYGAISVAVVDPNPLAPRGDFVIGTAAPAAVPGSNAGRIWIGQGLRTAAQLTSETATSPLTDQGTGTVNAMQMWINNSIRIDENGNGYFVGIQAADLTVTNALTADRLYLKTAQLLDLVNGDNHNVTFTDKSVIRAAGPTGAWAITGIAGGADGEIRYIDNASGQSLTIKHENAGSTAANRILTSTGADVVIGAGRAVVTLIYNGTDGRWVLVD